MNMVRSVLAASIISLALTPCSLVAQASGTWLDKSLTGWNQPGAIAAAPPSSGESREALARRCASSSLRGSPAADALSKAGWVPFRHLDREVAREDIEVIGGMSAAGPGCEARLYNLFVFVGGRFAGTLSPVAMTPDRDGEVGAVRITSAVAMTAEFGRYLPGDPECCPSSRVRVTFRIERRGARPVVEPLEARQIR